jgi:ParB-like chromosome segregation protein Spo0J
MAQLLISRVKTATLSADPKNARRHPQRNLDAITLSLKTFGQQKPLVVDADGVVVAGNGTLAAAVALGWDEIDVVRTDLRGAAARAYALADNKAGDLAGWDEEKLAAALAEVACNEDMDALATGFTAEEMEAAIKAVAGPEDFKSVDETLPVNCTCPKCGYQWSDGK